jgi:hypothetical protein
MCKWEKSLTRQYKDVDAKRIWAQWKDIDNWPTWHDDLDYCKLDGKFEAGNHFMLKPKNMGPVKIDLISIDEGKEFTDCTNFPGAKMFDIHRVAQIGRDVEVTNIIYVTGPLKWLWIWLVARKVASGAQSEMDKVVELARK